MKNYRRNQWFISILIILATGLLIASFIIPQVNIPIYVKYALFAFLGFSISLEALYINFYNEMKRLTYLENKMGLWNSISYRVKRAGEVAFNKIPIGIVVYDTKNMVEWANNYAKEIFMSPLVERNLHDLADDVATFIQNKQPTFQTNIYGKTYDCQILPDHHVLYLTDVTEKTNVLVKYRNRTLALGILNLDNFDEALEELDPQERSMQIANLIGLINNWAEKYHFAVKSFTEQKFLLIIHFQIVEKLMNSNFDIIEQIKDYCLKQNLRLTASIGIACNDDNPIDLMEQANEQLNLALDRGGNQAVVKTFNEVQFFGAKTESFETRTPIGVRIKAEELRDIIMGASNVVIMSHKDMDADAFGSCVALRSIAKSLNKEATIAFSEQSIDDTVINIYDSIKQEHLYYLTAFMNPKEILSIMNDNTLLIIVDCQYQNLFLDERIYKKAKKLAIIDHHRRNFHAVNDYNYIYALTSASSSVELVVELIDYMGIVKYELSDVEANWLLLGIIVDTNNFLYRTSERTFRVLAKLQTFGAQIAKVLKYLREDSRDFTKRVQFLNNIDIIDGTIGIAVCDDDIYKRAFIAKVADNVIAMENLKMAFAIGKIAKDTVGISARSFDEGNVQIVMEKMGGGGHYNNAAAQLKVSDVKEVKAQLLQILKEQHQKGVDSMKVILTANVKGKGKVNDIIDIPAGHANFLIRSGQAIEATIDNIKHLEFGKMVERQEAEKHLKEMQELKLKVESSPIQIGVRVGKAGKLFGSVSTKQIVDEFKSQFNLDLDKRKIIMDKDVDALGTYKIPIQLHKEVTAIITLYVVEKGL
ncbi:MAG: 50S ribosomal protein L9 [Bacilli bacterium]|jgi:ribosomal protein L9|nr:50S ribosomal protein L9 [Bacilli bacterium]MDY0064350.1 50S ribosomal protein L9 [Bacilli bacterium]